MKKVKKVEMKDAIEAVVQVEAQTGVAIKTGLRAGGGIGGTKGGDLAQPLYGAPNNNV